MANIRQYIGARYTIKIYENSQDAGSAEWEANTSYEPLVMVTYNNSSYLSKKDVPATIGNPAQNPLYWIVTGAYNGQIAALQHQVEQILNEIGDIGTLEDTVEHLVNGFNTIDKNYVKFEYGDIIRTKYNYTDYSIDVVKIPRSNQDGSVNKPIVKGQYNATDFYKLSKGSMAACNAGFFNASNGTLLNGLKTEGIVIQGDAVSSSDPYTCYLAIDSDGKFKLYDRTTPISDIPEDNVVMAFCPLLENGAISPNIKTDSDTTQQQIGYDSDMNYYIVTTSYKCPLTWTDMANWLLTNIPNAHTFYAVDSGGSTMTTVADVRTNLLYDMKTQNGRPVCGCIKFPKVNNTGNIDVLDEVVRLVQNMISPKIVFDANESASVELATGIYARWSRVYQAGNLVFGNMTFEVDSNYTPNSWVSLNLSIPNPDSHFYANMFDAADSSKTGKLEIVNVTSQSSTNNHIEVKFTNSGTYALNLVYATKQYK